MGAEMKDQGYRWGLDDWLADPELDGRAWRFSFEKSWRPCLYVGLKAKNLYDPRAVRCGQINTDKKGVSDHPITPKGRGISTEKISKTPKT